jgi:hypothetical protein
VENDRSEIRWSPRVPKSRIRRLYESEAKGLLDEELLDDIGMSLLLRCLDILSVEEARHGRVRCPRCDRRGEQVCIERKSRTEDELLRCPRCSWQITWLEYRRTFQRRQLNIGGAGRFIKAFAEQYPRARRPVDKMLAIDRLIHEFHYSLRGDAGRPTRALCVNFIEGKLTDVVAFLDSLSSGGAVVAGLAETRADWHEKLAATGHCWLKRPCS